MHVRCQNVYMLPQWAGTGVWQLHGGLSCRLNQGLNCSLHVAGEHISPTCWQSQRVALFFNNWAMFSWAVVHMWWILNLLQVSKQHVDANMCYKPGHVCVCFVVANFFVYANV